MKRSLEYQTRPVLALCLAICKGLPHTAALRFAGVPIKINPDCRRARRNRK